MTKIVLRGDQEVVANLTSLPDRLRQELRIGIGRAALIVQREVKQGKLSGQVLKVRTGRLRRSVNVRNTEAADSVSASVGTNVSYGKAHEFGFRGVVTVKEHLRRTKSGFLATVRAHPRNVVLPERSFLRSALRDMEPKVVDELASAVGRALKKF